MILPTRIIGTEPLRSAAAIRAKDSVNAQPEEKDDIRKSLTNQATEKGNAPRKTPDMIFFY